MPRMTDGHVPSDDHHHGMSLDDTSDFMNTLEYESGFLVDHLVSFDDAAHWLTDRGFCHEDLAPASLAAYGTSEAQALEKVRRVRGALRDGIALRLGRGPLDDGAVHRTGQAGREE